MNARNDYQEVFGTFVVVFGALFNAYIYGNFAALMTQLNKKENLFDDTMNIIQATVKSLRLPDQIRDTAFEYLMTIEGTPLM